MPDEDRERLGHTFNEAAGSYHRVRPDYPAELFDDLIAIAGLAPGDHLLEVGCGPGKATLPLARRGFRVTCIEPGPELAAAARRNLAGLDAEVIEGRFEEWRARPGERFDLVYAATAWHWIDPAVRYRQAWQVLRPGGHLAFWSALHVFPDGGDPFFREIQEVYEEIGEGLPAGEGGPARANCGSRAPRSRRAGCSTWRPSGTTTGSGSTTRKAISGCSARSPAISPCSRGSRTGSTGRSGPAWPAAPATRSAATGARSCTSRAAAAERARPPGLIRQPASQHGP